MENDVDIGSVEQQAPVLAVMVDGERYFRVHDEAGVKVFSAACPHMGGQVEDVGACFECPLHGWRFDQATGRALNATGAGLAEIATVEREGRLYVRLGHQRAANVETTEPIAAPADLAVRLIAHSCLEVRRGQFGMLTDPWVEGPAMLGAWTQYPPATVKVGELRPEAVWISHEHSDHFHEPTLAGFDRGTAIYFPDFPNGRIPRRLGAMGFTNLRPMPFGERVEIGGGIALTCYEPASLWNDAIVLMEVEGFRLLNLNDAGLNRRIATLVGRVDAVASAFTPGASGYPLTWRHLSVARQDEILERACAGMLEMLREAVRMYGCSSLIPYAGHFALWHPLHRGYLERMRKNTLEDVKGALEGMGVQVVDLLPGEKWIPATRGIERVWKQRERLFAREHQRKYVEQVFDAGVFERHHGREEEATLTTQELDAYFLRLNDVPEMAFCEELTVEVAATDLKLEKVEFVRRYAVRGGRLLVDAGTGEANLTMRVPRTVLAKIVGEDLSWDESHIGYWCEFSRSPDVYHGGFWRLLQAPYYRRAGGALPKELGGRVEVATGVGDVVERYGVAAERILRRYGMYCGGCHRAASESIGQAAAMHGIDANQLARLVVELNEALGERHG